MNSGNFPKELMEFVVLKRCTPEAKMKKIAARVENLKSRIVEIQEAGSVDVSIFYWKGESFLADEVSVQNGLLITRAQLFPLCIGQQLQVVR